MNRTELAAAAAYRAEGWQVLSTGWPDFLLHRKGASGEQEIRFSEVKPSGGKLHGNQEAVLQLLSSLAPTEVRYVSEEEKTLASWEAFEREKEQAQLESYEKWEKSNGR